MTKPILDKLGRERDLTCNVVGCINIKQRDGCYPSGTQRYHSLCGHHRYLKRKGLSVDYETRPCNSQERNVFRGGFVQGKCTVDGCDRPQVSKGLRYDVRRYDIYCTGHRQLEKQGLPLSLNIDCCSICGWDGPCDKHRLKHGVEGGKYTEDNVVVVCPNCHRDYHRGVDPYCRVASKEVVA